MRDLMMEMYTAFSANADISEHVQDIRFFEFPNANDIVVGEPVIVIDDLMAPLPSDFGDNQYMSYQYLFQVDLFMKNDSSINSRLLSTRLILIIQEIMWLMGFHVNMSGKPEYDSDFEMYRSTITFRTKKYK